ncbi:uncharacterized protein ARMOST_06117 [Armillaria ostoyae]|uniref:DUF6534 domain-containing protein n=1 Tax=Armillaria ostoyae TaxID=47428 RepID=A0A284R223_ARMOS|nr:uncharacterized protein ARMOST_06117 [Armillaria ostoyae]
MALAGALQLDNTVGAFEIAVTIASLLFGVLCVQVWKYSNDYQRDPWYMKALVATIFVGNLFHQLCLNHSLYSYTVTHWGDIDVLVSIPWSFLGLVTASGFVAFMVQSFYVYRIWRLSNGNYLLTCPLAAISVAEFIVNMYAVDGARRITVYTDQVKIKPYLLAYNALGAVEDCLLAGTMMLLLLKSRTRFKKTNTMITRLMMYCVNTGIFTSMAALLTIITLAIWDETMIDHPFYFALPRRSITFYSIYVRLTLASPVYGASLFGLLNARNDIRNGTPNNGYSSNEIPLSLARSAHTAAAPIQSLSPDPPRVRLVAISRHRVHPKIPGPLLNVNTLLSWNDNQWTKGWEFMKGRAFKQQSAGESACDVILNVSLQSAARQLPDPITQ